MLNSAENEIVNAHKYKKYQEIQLFFYAQISLECYISCSYMLNTKNYWHFNIYKQENFMFRWVEHNFL